MPHLDLDFLRARPTSPWIRWVLLAIALGFAAEVGLAYYGARTRIARNEEALAQLQRASDGAANAASSMRPPSPEEIKVARDTIQRLSTPWDQLFRALESAASNKVALLAIEPDARSGTVLISGEAADYRAVLDYIAALNASGTLERPHLVRHERQQNDPQKAVRFAVSAGWSNDR